MAGRIHPLGAVAQLGERRVRNAKVRGSIPLGSTNTPSTEVRESPKAGANTGFFIGCLFNSILLCPLTSALS
jgi:hypothetical protein